MILAANTAYADFPGLASIIARDGFLPRQFFNRGARLVFSNGVIFLAAIASILIVVFNGDISKLIPLYAFGVFTGFTLSQAGMVRHHLKHKVGELASEPGDQRHRRGLHRAHRPDRRGLQVHRRGLDPGRADPDHGVRVPRDRQALQAGAAAPSSPRPATAPRARRTRWSCSSAVSTRACCARVQYARSLNPDRILAVTVASNDEERKAVEDQWKAFEVPIELHTVYSPYRELTRPILQFIDELDERYQDDIITVVIPEFVTSWGTQWLHNGSAFALKAKLLYRPHTAVVSVPIHTMGDHTEEE